MCLCEGADGQSIDAVFIYKLIRCLNPNWIRPWGGSNTIRPVSCGGRKDVIERMPKELKNCLNAGGNTTLMVWADLDHNRANGDELKADFWEEAKKNDISRVDFDRVVFIFAKDRLENWIEFLKTGKTDESIEGPRVKHNRTVANAAKRLADYCIAGKPVDDLPPSLQWSCKNWRRLTQDFR